MSINVNVNILENDNDFGKILNRNLQIEENYIITSDNCKLPNRNLQIEYVGIEFKENQTFYVLDVPQYFIDFKCNYIQLHGEFQLRNFINNGVIATFSYRLKSSSDLRAVYILKLIDYSWMELNNV